MKIVIQQRAGRWARLVVIYVLWLCLRVVGFDGYAEGVDQASVVVIANEQVPESIDLARYYMDKRGIPPANLCVLSLPTGELISRHSYNSRLRDPLLAFLRKQGLVRQTLRDEDEIGPNQSAWLTKQSSVRYLVAMYGVPLRVSDVQAMVKSVVGWGGHYLNDTRSAVDSELTMILAPPYNLNGPVSCPAFALRYYQELRKHTDYFILATRLDGPDIETVRRMIDRSLFAERYGLSGRMYFDSRGVRDLQYKLGDDWIVEAYERFRREGFECILDTKDELLPASYPMQDAVGYFGWYNKHAKGPFLNEGFTFQPGAIAYHIHSYSGKSLRTKSLFWMGPLLKRGAVATMGAVYEPYLSFTPNLDIFADRLCRGLTFAEAVYASLRVVSWQISIAGDPLYRPFRYSLDEQIQHLMADKVPGLEWAYLRKLNLLVRDGRFKVGLDFGLKKIEETNSLVLRERLGDLYSENGMVEDADKQYATIIEHTLSSWTAVRVGLKWIQILKEQGSVAKADRVLSELEVTWKGQQALSWLEMNK